MSVTELPDTRQEFGMAWDDAALTLDGFQEDGRCIRIDETFEALEVVEPAKRETAEERAKVLLDFLLRSGTHSSKSPAVKGILGANHSNAGSFFTRLARPVESGQLEQSFIGFGSAIAEKYPARTCFPDKAPGEFALQGIAKEIAHMDQFTRLAPNGLDPMWMAMTEGGHRDAGGKIEIAPAAIVPDM